MGTYLNCGNEAFRQIRNGIYVDKTELIEYINSTIGTMDNLTCFSRPRRFGKSFAAMMLAAYYDKSCDSKELFEGLEISKSETCEKYMNQFDVIYLDITWFISKTQRNETDIVSEIQDAVIRELKLEFPNYVNETERYLPDALLSVSQRTGDNFFIIIDEWDALFRETREDIKTQKSYIQLLRGLFKGGPAMKAVISGAYMTGILPIKKYGTESALTDFQEYSMINPDILSPYVGFTEKEVINLCQKNHVDFEEMKCWYDGYTFENAGSVYNPNSVISAIKRRKFRSYWTASETYESLKQYIIMNFDGLKDSIIAMLGGERIWIEPLSFQNDITSFRNKDDVLTLLIHLGYLGYDSVKKEVYIPNLEVAEAFKLAVQDTDWRKVGTALKKSEELLNATIKGDCETVAVALDEIHSAETTSILQYNDENSLSCVIMIAYYTSRNYYSIIREFPSGKGYADLVFIPHPHVDKPAMIIELKYNKSAKGAIRQIKDRKYSGALNNYSGNLLLVGINYDKSDKNKKHTCVIEKYIL